MTFGGVSWCSSTWAQSKLWPRGESAEWESSDFISKWLKNRALVGRSCCRELQLQLRRLGGVTCGTHQPRLCNLENRAIGTFRRPPPFDQGTQRALHFDSTSRQQHVSTNTCGLHREAAMAQEMGDAIGQLVR